MIKMKFSHITDCHLGAWKEPKMQELNLESFNKAIGISIQEKVDFVLITGDLFDTAIPPIEIIASCAEKLKNLKENNIPCYIIAGSHDFSASGKTIITVLEKAGLCMNVSYNLSDNSQALNNKFFSDKNYFISGLAGKKLGLEQKDLLDFKEELDEKKFNILGLHTTIKELLPKSMINQVEKGNIDAISAEEILKNEKLKKFNYFALGHIHNPLIKEIKGEIFAYPGALFPNNFSEIVENKKGGFLIINFREGKNTQIEDIKEIPIEIKKVQFIDIDANGLNPSSLREKIFQEAKNFELEDKILAIKIQGTIENGKISDIEFDEIETYFQSRGVYCLLKSISKLESKEFQIQVKESEGKTIEEIEEHVINSALEQEVISLEEKTMMNILIKNLDTEKIDGETNETFANRIMNDIIHALNIKEIWN